MPALCDLVLRPPSLALSCSACSHCEHLLSIPVNPLCLSPSPPLSVSVTPLSVPVTPSVSVCGTRCSWETNRRTTTQRTSLTQALCTFRYDTIVKGFHLQRHTLNVGVAAQSLPCGWSLRIQLCASIAVCFVPSAALRRMLYQERCTETSQPCPGQQQGGPPLLPAPVPAPALLHKTSLTPPRRVPLSLNSCLIFRNSHTSHTSTPFPSITASPAERSPVRRSRLGGC